jgi:hypothetical protein
MSGRYRSDTERDVRMKRVVIALIAGAALLIAGRTLFRATQGGPPAPAYGVVSGIDPDRGDANRGSEVLPPELPAEPTLLDSDRWADAATRVVRLSPDSSPNVPVDIRRRITADGCTVPQRWTPRNDSLERGFDGLVRGYEPTAPPVAPTNLISGEFGAEGQRDWAVLCSINGRSSIRVYWGGPSACQTAFELIEDVRLLQDYTFDYAIEKAAIPTMRSIARNVEERDGDLNLPPLTHDGIHFHADKASITAAKARGSNSTGSLICPSFVPSRPSWLECVVDGCLLGSWSRRVGILVLEVGSWRLGILVLGVGSWKLGVDESRV